MAWLEARGEQYVARWRRGATRRFEGHGNSVGLVDRALNRRCGVSFVARFEEPGGLRDAVVHEPGCVYFVLRGGGQVFRDQNGSSVLDLDDFSPHVLCRTGALQVVCLAGFK